MHFVDGTALDPIGAMTVLKPLFEGMGVPLPEGVGLEDLQIDVRMRVDVDVSVSDGWPAAWSSEMQMTAPGYTKIVRTIVTLAHNLGMETVAEGVETASQLEVLREMGCDKAQGFYVAEALPADVAVALAQALVAHQ